MFRRVLSAIRRRSSVSPTGSPPLTGGFPDVDWSMRVENSVVRDARRQAEAVISSYPLGIGLRPAGVLFDHDRGSLRLQPQGRPELVLAVADRVAAENIAAAFMLGGLSVSLARADLGLVLVEGLWEGRVYRLYGIPAIVSPV